MTEAFRHDDPYRVLGLARGAAPAEITRAYRMRARIWHPDVRQGDPEAAARFRALSDAYETLTDPARRADYERECAREQEREQEEVRRHSPAAPVWPSPPAMWEGWVRHVRARPATTTMPADDPPLRAGPVWIEPDPPGDEGRAW